MIAANELRLGNYILQKSGNKISTAKCSFELFELLSKGDHKFIYPILLKPDILQKCGFEENKKYPLYPQAREFILILPVSNSNKNEIFVYIKSNGEAFGRVTLNGLPASNNFYNLHTLQNVYYALTGQELAVNM